MNLIRRIFGLPTDTNAASADDGITITRGEEFESAAPPEPVVEVSPPSKGSSEPAAETAVRLGPEDDTIEVTNSAVFMGTRPLPPLETVQPGPGKRLQFGQFSDVGMVRGNNQDAMLTLLASGSSNDALPDFGLFIVADGMGGHQEGERASAITTRMVSRHVVQAIYVAILEQRMNDPDRPSIAEVLRTAVQQANDSVTEEIPEGGTTVTACAILGDLAYFAHVGDSRAYLITDDRIEQITRDHSLVQRLIELDQLTPEEAAEHPQRNVLYRAIGQSDTLDVDAITRRLPPHSRLLLCSDGLWNMVSEDTIRQIVTETTYPQDACDKLVKLANDRGGPDNVTVIVVQVPG